MNENPHCIKDEPAGFARRVRSMDRRQSWVGSTEFTWIWGGLLGVFVLSFAISPGTLAYSSLSSMLAFAGVLAIAAVGQTLVIQQRGLDLSLPSTMALAALVFAKRSDTGSPVAFALVAALTTSVTIGVGNGLLVTRLYITPLIATLAMDSLVLAAVWGYSKGLPVAVPDGLGDLTRSSFLNVPNVVWMALIPVVFVAVVISKSVVGRRFTFAGANPYAAASAGIKVHRYVIASYVGSAVCAGLAGILLAGYTGGTTVNLGVTYLLPSIAAVVVGGTPLTGGRGSVIASAAAALFLAQLSQLALSLGAPTSAQLLIQSACIVLAVGLRRVAWNRLLSRAHATGDGLAVKMAD